jgi:hypothetical protein
VTKLRRIIWAVHVANRLSGRVEMHMGFGWRNLRERNHLENLGVDGNIKRDI